MLIVNYCITSKTDQLFCGIVLKTTLTFTIQKGTASPHDFLKGGGVTCVSLHSPTILWEDVSDGGGDIFRERKTK